MLTFSTFFSKRRTAPLAHLVALVFFILASGCTESDAPPTVYHNAYSSSGEGYGIDSYVRDQEAHYPMAYALVASAEANRFTKTKNSKALERAISHAEWLCANQDLNNDGVTGWGIPFAWDAFGDKSTNPPHTEYSITSSLAILGLLDTVDAIDHGSLLRQWLLHEQRQRFVQVARAAVDAVIDGSQYTGLADGSTSFWYSSRPEDAYPVININAMFAGVLQRISIYADAPQARQRYRSLADSTVRYLLNSKTVQGDAWYWNYYEPLPAHRSQNVENDGVHAAYVVDGLLTYKEFGGAHASEIEQAPLKKGLLLLVNGQQVMELFSRPKRPVVPWSLGYLLYVFSRYWPEERIAADLFYGHILLKQTPEGFRFTDQADSPAEYIRHNAHVLLGLSHYFWP